MWLPDEAFQLNIHSGPSSRKDELMEIRLDDLSSPEILRLMHDHLQSAALHSPPESVHALDVAALRRQDITFWSAWNGSELMGCGAIKDRLIHAMARSSRCAPFLYICARAWRRD